MLPVRRSGATTVNSQFVEVKAKARESNLAWMNRVCDQVEGLTSPGDIILLGGSSLAEFRVRVAQSHVRDDLTPSYWSLVGVLDEGDTLLTAPLWPLAPPHIVPARNGIERLALSHFDDPDAWPNVAVIHFQARSTITPVEAVASLAGQRSIVDLPTLILDWLAYVWGTGTGPNPLVNGSGLPSAVLVETAFGIAQVELTPGLASASSCPEAIYQAAKWWHEFYADTAGEGVDAAKAWPAGRFALRQRAATYREPDPPRL
jgi:hypothetical protein